MLENLNGYQMSERNVIVNIDQRNKNEQIYLIPIKEIHRKQ